MSSISDRIDDYLDKFSAKVEDGTVRKELHDKKKRSHALRIKGSHYNSSKYASDFYRLDVDQIADKAIQDLSLSRKTTHNYLASKVFVLNRLKLKLEADLNHEKANHVDEKAENSLSEVVQRLDAVIEELAVRQGLLPKVSSIKDVEAILKQAILCPEGFHQACPAKTMEEFYVALEEVKQKLSDWYGGPIDDIVQAYQLAEKKYLNILDFQALLVGTVANLTQDQVKKMVAVGSFPFQLVKLIKGDLLGEIDPENLTDEQIGMIVTQLREVPLLESPFEFPAAYVEQLAKDSQFIHVTHQVENFNLDRENSMGFLNQYSHAEYLAKSVSYPLFYNSRGKFATSKTWFRPGTLIPIYMPDKNKDPQLKLTAKALYPLIQAEGIHGAIALPLDPAKEKGAIDVQFFFRGFDDLTSGRRILRPSFHKKESFGAVGYYEFQKYRSQLENKLEKTLLDIHEKTKRPIHLEVIGHSLAGADAQMFTGLITESLAKAADPSHPLHDVYVASIAMHAFNAPGVSEGIAKSFSEDANSISEIPVSLNYFKVAHDPVQLFGYTLLGPSFEGEKAEIPPLNVQASVFLLDRARFLKVEGFADPAGLFGGSHNEFCLANHQKHNALAPNDALLVDLVTNNPHPEKYPIGIDGSKAPQTSDSELLKALSPFYFHSKGK